MKNDKSNSDIQEPKEPENSNGSGINLRVGAWAPWLPLFVIGTGFVSRAGGFMGEFIFFALYAAISWPIGAIVYRHYKSDQLARIISACLLFGGPVYGLFLLEKKQDSRIENRNLSKVEIKKYCTEFGREEIHSTIADVEGIFLLDTLPHTNLGPATKGASNLYSIRQQQKAHINGQNLFKFDDNIGYQFIEHLPPGADKGPPYIRREVDRSHMPGEKPSIQVTQQKTLKSKYGWRSSNLTTKHMRDHFIVSWKIDIVRLETGEVIASHRGFNLGDRKKEAGSTGRPENYKTNDSCDSKYKLQMFLKKVLIPKN